MTADQLDEVLAGVVVDSEVRQLRPDHAVLIIASAGLLGGPSDDASRKALREASEAAAAANLLDHPHLEAWRCAHRSFGANPTRYRSSVEALLRRVDKGGVPAINRLVDIYNAVSIRHALPVGGEDLSAISGSYRLCRAVGTEEFDTVDHGQPAVEHPEPGEVIWRDDLGVTCRRWSHRQCRRTMLTESTTRAVFILECLSPTTTDELLRAGVELTRRIVQLSPDAVFRSRLLTANGGARPAGITEGAGNQLRTVSPS